MGQFLETGHSWLHGTALQTIIIERTRGRCLLEGITASYFLTVSYPESPICTTSAFSPDMPVPIAHMHDRDATEVDRIICANW
jgi:hypothetical protein